MITVEELIIQSLYHRMVVVNVRRTPSFSPTGGRVDALGLLISGAQRMRSAMGAQGQLPQGQPAEPQPGTSSSSSSQDGDQFVGDNTGKCVMQIKSRQNTIDFSDDVQTILDTGEIKLVKAIQKSTETQTEFTPVWFFGFDPTHGLDPTGSSTQDVGEAGAVANANGEQLNQNAGVKDIPAVDLSKFDQFSVVHYSDTRDPENRSLVMIQTPGSKMYKPGDICHDQISVMERTGLEVPTHRQRQTFGKSKSLDNSAIPTRISPSLLRQQDDQEKTNSEDETGESREGDVSFRDHDIDSGIWDMVQGRESRLSARGPQTPGLLQDMLKLQPDHGKATAQHDDVHEGPEEGSQEEVSWQEMYNQLAAQSGDGDRPTMSYRMFSIEDQVLDHSNKPETVVLESSMPITTAAHVPYPIGSSTPKPRIKINEEESDIGSTLREDKDSNIGTELRSTDSTMDDVFVGESMEEEAEAPPVEEDSGWLFDKVAELQGSLVHTPTSPSSPKTFPRTKEEAGGDTDLATPAVEEVLEAQTVESLEATTQVKDSVSDSPILYTMGELSLGHMDKAGPDSTSTLDTVIRTEAESNGSRRSDENVSADVSERHVSRWDCDGSDSHSQPPIDLRSETSSGIEEQVSGETREEVTLESLGDFGPSTGLGEDVSVIDFSQESNNGDLYESCDEGSLLDDETVLIKSPGSDFVEIDNGEVALPDIHIQRKSRTFSGKSPKIVQAPNQSPLSKPTSPLIRPVSMGPNQSPGCCVVHHSGARPKVPLRSAQRRSQGFGLQSLFSEDTSTIINGHSSEGPGALAQDSKGADDVYLLNRDGTLSNTNTGVVYRSGARPRGAFTHGRGAFGAESSLQGLNSLMMKSTSSTVVHSHVVTELTAARARLNVPELRRTPERHSVASSDSEYASVDSSLATSPTSTSVEELASVGSDTCLLSEVMPVASYADWMAQLPKRLHAVPLTQLAIPGSNISFAIETDMRTDMSFSKCNLEMAEFLRKMPPLAVFDNFRKIMKDIWRAWMPKQLLSVAKQLEAGVRYLDVRITRYRGTFYGEHGLYTRHLKHYLKQVEEFIQAHPKEVIILHFQKFVNLTPKDKRSLVTLLFQFFGAKLCRVMDVANITLEEMWACRKQIIAIFPASDMSALSNHIFAGLIWSSKIARSSLPRKQTTQELVTYLESVYDEEREESEFHVLQAVVSPDMNMVFGEYEHKSMRSLTLYETSPYLKVWLPGKSNLNIVAVDFVGIYDLTGEIIRLNDEKKAETVV